tara:strand:- start:739 stop:1098 length:360 start_codon:yes stop_codon:yes gene_type:complete
MCGTAERIDLFEEECVIDSKETLSESLYDLISQLSGKIQLAPCDAYLADADLFSKIDGVPTDDLGNRQPLLAKISTDNQLRRSVKISEMFQDIGSCEGGIKARNTNTPEEFKEILSHLN